MTTERNAMAWEWLAQQYGASISTVCRLCEVSRPRGYELARTWQQAGFVHTQRMPSEGPGGSWSNELWVWPTRETAWAFLGFDPGPWFPRLTTVAHTRALAELRLTLTGRELDPEVWTSERLLRRESNPWRSQCSRHVHDGWFTDGSGDRWAVEVELSVKSRAGRAVRSLRAALEAAHSENLTGVVYFVRGRAVRRSVDNAARILSEQGQDELLAMLDIRDLDRFLTGTTNSEEAS
ncbi:hypothetical protein [Nocardia transvalensis]|uniref:hypothetical protein n=1 Tax=Nocardia transvalensis TaxID=37333 RepID=UPI00189583F6|nr:hypothetical protein [Nocardia transvalensis]MBF6329782.1 hypothetical protein [Nocardia transvalensis]